MRSKIAWLVTPSTLFLAIVVLGTPATAAPAKRACRQTQTVVVAGQTIDTDQCMENRGVTDEQFVAACTIGKDGIPALKIPPMKIVFLDSCPKKAVHVCEGFGQGHYTSYYYNKGDVAERKTGCEATGGKLR